ncbi:MAG TPA: PilZ domain-containing protein [Nitrospiria bacterium]|nr:PilZ domain-containing protein [Nitrospiria bacterium]
METPGDRKDTPKAADKRKSLRSPIIVLKVSAEGDRKRLFGYAKNVSRGGLYIQSVNPRQPGDQFAIAFQIPNTEIRVECRCEVVWKRGYNPSSKEDPGYGVRFLDLPIVVADAIDQWVKQQR